MNKKSERREPSTMANEMGKSFSIHTHTQADKTLFDLIDEHRFVVQGINCHVQCTCVGWMDAKSA